MLPAIVIMKIEENQPSKENIWVKSRAIRFLPSTSASGESDFTIKCIYSTFFFLFVSQHDIGQRGQRGDIRLICSF